MTCHFCQSELPSLRMAAFLIQFNEGVCWKCLGTLSRAKIAQPVKVEAPPPPPKLKFARSMKLDQFVSVLSTKVLMHPPANLNVEGNKLTRFKAWLRDVQDNLVELESGDKFWPQLPAPVQNLFAAAPAHAALLDVER